jgi:hypothetical protein
MKTDTKKKAFLSELESLLESEEVYNANINILNCQISPEGEATGRFKDSWNGRVFDFILDNDGISYKPAVNLDSCTTEADRISRIDSFSAGYTSGLVENQDAVKRTKKPKCGNTNYGCGYSCIDIRKNCKIGVEKISRERINKLQAMAKAIALEGKSFKGVGGGLVKPSELIATSRNLQRERIKTQKGEVGFKNWSKNMKISLPAELEKKEEKSLTSKEKIDEVPIKDTNPLTDEEKKYQENLTPETFNDVVSYKTATEDEFFTERTKTYEEWVKDKSRTEGTKAKYRMMVTAGIGSGVPINDEVIASTGKPLSKQQDTENKKNREIHQGRLAEYKKIKKLIDRSNDLPGKPFFDDSEFYHGSDNESLNSIMKDGISTEAKGGKDIYGAGFYLAVTKMEALTYSGAKSSEKRTNEVGVIHTKVTLKNPYIVDTDKAREMTDKLGEGRDISGSQEDAGMDYLTDYLKAKGYDGLYAKDKGYLNVYNSHQLKPVRITQGLTHEKYSKARELSQKLNGVDQALGSNPGASKILGRDPKYKKLIQQHPELKKDRSDSEMAALLRGYLDVRSL